MKTIFDSTLLPREDRFRAWQEQICDLHFQVDVATDNPLDHYLRVRETQFGAVRLTQDIGGAGVASRRRKHLAKQDTDDVHILLITDGAMSVVQSGVTSNTHSGALSFYRMSEPFDLIVPDRFQAVMLELPCERFAERFRSGHLPNAGRLALTGGGIGRIAAEFCRQLVLEGPGLDEGTKASLGEQVIDVIALALDDGCAEVPDRSIQQARLRSIKAFIERNLDNPALTPARIAGSNDISLSYLHHLFKGSGHSVFEWVWHRRLERCYQMIAASHHRHRTITEIAETMGFSNLSHFSNLFRKKFGIRPSELRQLDFKSPIHYDVLPGNSSSLM